MNKLEKKCVNCKYLGLEVEHLRNYENIPEWRVCNFPLAYHTEQRAISITKYSGESCKCFQQKKPWFKFW